MGGGLGWAHAMKHVRWGLDLPMRMGNFEGAAHCKVWELSAVSRPKAAEPIEMPFWTWTGRSNHVLEGVTLVQPDEYR